MMARVLEAAPAEREPARFSPVTGHPAAVDSFPGAIIGDVAAVALLALLVRLVQIDRPPQFDELYHLLAGRSWATDGTFALAGGEYARAPLFTVLVGLAFKVLGVSLVAARMPSAVAGVLWVAAVHLWTARRAGRLAGACAGLLLCFDPGAIYMSQFARFYALQGLLVWVGATLLYALVSEPMAPRRRLAYGLCMVVAWGVSFRLQITTLIGLAGVVLWAAGVVTLALRQRWGTGRTAAGLALLVLAAGTALLVSPAGMRLLAMYGSGPVWAQPNAHNWRYYEQWLVGRYPILWALFPAALGIAFAARRRPVAFAACIFVGSIAVFSFAAMKTERYVYFAIPGFFVIWGIALATLVPWLGRLGERIVAGGALASAPRAAQSALIGLGVALVLGAGLFYNPGYALTRDMLRRGSVAKPYLESDWGRAAPVLRRLADSADVVVSTALPKSLYYIDRGDVTLSVTELTELDTPTQPPPDFSVDPRTGRPAIASVDALRTLLACEPSGLVVVELPHWRRGDVVTEAAADFIAAHTQAIELPPEWRLMAFRWTRPLAVGGVDCAVTHGLARQPAQPHRRGPAREH
jgi:4-amino-4-deoxy-L-arabinose transferase-like glycosyltransferase